MCACMHARRCLCARMRVSISFTLCVCACANIYIHNMQCISYRHAGKTCISIKYYLQLAILVSILEALLTSQLASAGHLFIVDVHCRLCPPGWPLVYCRLCLPGWPLVHCRLCPPGWPLVYCRLCPPGWPLVHCRL